MPSAAAQSYSAAGDLVAGSGTGRRDATIWAPTMRFPMESGPAYANSQVYGAGGLHGPRGGQCDVSNYSYPWRDNYCESRSWAMPLCPAGRGHQGQDIRPGVCRAGVVPGVAVADGRITNVGSYSVYLTTANGTRYDYLHMSRVAVRVGDRVRCGDVLGYVSNVFGSTPTTIHLHFNIRQAVRGVGSVFVPPYTSLIAAHDRLLAGTEMCAPPPDAGRPDAGPRDAGARDAGRDAGTIRMCRSSVLGRNVADGECVQTAPEMTSCAGGCSWARCVAGAWECASDMSMCTGATHANAACGSGGATCRSATLGRDVEHGACVQVEYAGCGMSSCGWYRCVDGGWTCSDISACTGERNPRPSCGGLCSEIRGICETRLECCGASNNSNMICYEGYCEDRTRCLPNGSTSCTTMIDGPNQPHCCGAMICGLNTAGTSECCNIPGQPCSSSVDCCGYEACTGGVCQPVTSGGRCMNTQECIGADYCNSAGVCSTSG